MNIYVLVENASISSSSNGTIITSDGIKDWTTDTTVDELLYVRATTTDTNHTTTTMDQDLSLIHI